MRIWNLRLNLDEFNALYGVAFTPDDRSQVLMGLFVGCNGGDLPEDTSKLVRRGFEVSSVWRSEAEGYALAKSEGGKTSAKIRQSKYGTPQPSKSPRTEVEDTSKSPRTDPEPIPNPQSFDLYNPQEKDMSPSAPCSPSGKVKKEKPPKKIRTTALKPESQECFGFLWAEFPKSHNKWDQETKCYKDYPLDPGSKFKAEERFQAIIDAQIATAYELYSSFHAYIAESPKVKDGFVQQVSTFFGVEKATYLQWLDRARQLIQESE